MSYHLYIRRDRSADRPSSNEKTPDKESNESLSNHGIELDDWLAAVEIDSAFSFIVNEGDSASAIFQGADSVEHMTWANGDIGVESPSAELLSKMLTLAARLDAKVIGSNSDARPDSNVRYLNSSAADRPPSWK